MADTGHPRAAVLGSPIAHSLSPALHRAAYRALGLPWHYDAIEVTQADLSAFVEGMDDQWAGLSLTMPLKEAVIDLLDEVDDLAAAITSVNTVLPSGHGWRGANTDVYGMTQALHEAGLRRGVSTGLILGAGATGRSAIAALGRLGATQVLISARRASAAQSLVAVADAFGLTAQVIAWQEGGVPPHGVLAHVQVTVSTVPQDAGAAWAGFAQGCSGALLDAAYHPWPTPLAAAWAGEVIANGRQMLLWQAAEQVRLMTGLPAPIDAMRAALPPS